MARVGYAYVGLLLILVVGCGSDVRIRPHVQNISQDGVTLIWETRRSVAGSVQYGAAHGELTSSAAEDAPGTIHRVRIEGLAPDTEYAYRIDLGDEVQEARFKTAPASADEIVFVVVGDPRRWDNLWSSRGFDEHVLQWDADLYLTMGDLVDDGHEYRQWPEHFERFEKLSQSKWFATARGNHEGSQIGDTKNDWFAKYHDLPGGEPYSTFEWGNTHFVLISYESTGREEDWKKSAEWLDDHLKTVESQYTVVAHHFPVYCTGYESTDLRRKEPGVLASAFRDVLDKHDVTLDVSGHTHIYERHYPLRADARNDRDGTFYLVNGGDIGGNYPDWWTAVGDDTSTMAKPTYTVFIARNDRLIGRTFAWSLEEKRIAQIDYFVLWEDERIPKTVVRDLSRRKGASLVEAIDTLGAMLYAPAADALFRYIHHDDSRVRESAARSLSLIANDAVAVRAIEHLGHSDARIGPYMARALEITTPEALVPQVLELAQNEDIADAVRFHLVGALQFHAEREDAARAMLSILGNRQGDERLRRRAAYALGQTAGQNDIDALRMLLKKERDRYVRDTIKFALTRLERNE